MVSEKTEEGVNLKGEVIEIVNLIRDISYKAIKKWTKRPVKKKGRVTGRVASKQIVPKDERTIDWRRKRKRKSN